ncbi:MAG TPA: BON domain-containing protein, partial [Chloroflexota bacterium]
GPAYFGEGGQRGARGERIEERGALGALPRGEGTAGEGTRRPGGAPTPHADARGARATVRDIALARAVSEALSLDPSLRRSGIAVGARGGEVLLDGVVERARLARRAVRLARAVPGVAAVRQRLTVG